MKRKLLSLLVLLMTAATGAWADDLNESFTTNSGASSYTGEHFRISLDDEGDGDGFFLSESAYARIEALNGEIITKVEFTRGYYDITALRSAVGTTTYEGEVATVSGVNATSLAVNAPDQVQIKAVKVYYTTAPATVNVTANEGATGEYWATYYNATQGFTADANTTVYQAKVNGTTTGVVLTEVASKEIPAGQGVVLKSSSSTITLTPATTTVTYSDNQLLGTDAALATPANAYCLSKETSGSSPRGVGFYTYTLATIPAHKAYLVVAGGPSTSRGFLGFDEDDNTTGIGLPEAVVIEGDGPVFDLSGRRVMGQPQKGIYVKNGKKFVIK